jgi:predicted alpha/beta-fold hydrolase
MHPPPSSQPTGPRTRTRRTIIRVLQLAAAVLVVLLGAIAIFAVVAKRSWPAVQLQAVAVLATTEATPVLAWAVRAVTAEPRIEETRVAGAPATLVRPGRGDGPWPAVVFVNGATRAGRHHPKVQRLARGLARAGFLVVVPDLPGLPIGKITPATVAATIDVAKATSAWSNVRDGRLGFYGVSVGAARIACGGQSRARWSPHRRRRRGALGGYEAGDSARYHRLLRGRAVRDRSIRLSRDRTLAGRGPSAEPREQQAPRTA